MSGPLEALNGGRPVAVVLAVVSVLYAVPVAFLAGGAWFKLNALSREVAELRAEIEALQKPNNAGWVWPKH